MALFFKWLTYSNILLFLSDYPGVQIPLLFYVSVFYQCYILRYQPYTEPLDNKLAFINELLVSAYLLVYIAFTDIVTSDAIRDSAGLALMTIVFSFFAINFLVVVC